MPQRRAAKKDLRKNKKRHEKNLKLKEQIKSAIKKFKKAIESKDFNAGSEALKAIYKILDKAASKKIIHPNNAAREKSRFSKKLNSIKLQATSQEKAP
jgi:small subunit ribosomal protein S20